MDIFPITINSIGFIVQIQTYLEGLNTLIAFWCFGHFWPPIDKIYVAKFNVFPQFLETFAKTIISFCFISQLQTYWECLNTPIDFSVISGHPVTEFKQLNLRRFHSNIQNLVLLARPAKLFRSTDLLFFIDFLSSSIWGSKLGGSKLSIFQICLKIGVQNIQI